MAQYKMFRGTTFVLKSTLFRGLDSKGARKPIDLTGAKLYFTGKKNLNDADPGAFQVSSPGSISILSPATAGSIVVAVPASATVAFPTIDVRLWYDITCIEADGTVSKPEWGEILVQPAATRAIA